MKLLINPAIQSIRHRQTSEGPAAVIAPYKSSLGLSLPVAPCRDDYSIIFYIRIISIDTGYISVSLSVIKGIPAWLIKFSECKRSKVTYNVKQLDISTHRCIHIKMNRLLNACALIMVCRVIRCERVTSEYSCSRIEPHLVLVERINFYIAEPVENRHPSIVLRPHVGGIKMYPALLESLKAYLPC